MAESVLSKPGASPQTVNVALSGKAIVLVMMRPNSLGAGTVAGTAAAEPTTRRMAESKAALLKNIAARDVLKR